MFAAVDRGKPERNENRKEPSSSPHEKVDLVVWKSELLNDGALESAFARDVPDCDSGAYQLLIDLDRSRMIRVGALGKRKFLRGIYAYTGRACRNLQSRVRRHLSTRKKLRWHVDYVLQHARVSTVIVFPNRPELECAIGLVTAQYGDARYPVPGFGSSDCRCPSHLVWLGRRGTFDLNGLTKVHYNFLSTFPSPSGSVMREGQ